MLGSDLAGLPISLAAPSRVGRENGSWSSSLPPGRLFGVVLGGHQMNPYPLVQPGPRIHPPPLPKASSQQVRVAGGHRVSPSSGCYGGLKITRAVQRGGSIPFFQESAPGLRAAVLYLSGKPFGVCLERGCERSHLLGDTRCLRSPGRAGCWHPRPAPSSAPLMKADVSVYENTGSSTLGAPGAAQKSVLAGGWF